MTARGIIRGHDAYYDATASQWCYTGTNQPVDRTTVNCPQCDAACGNNAPDPCIGTIPGVTSACCGHGRHDGYIIWAATSRTDRGVRRRGGLITDEGDD